MRLPTKLTSALKVTLLYMVFGGLWILLSDRILAALADSAAVYQQWQTYKGSAFVVASGLVIYLLVRREERLRQRGQRLFSEVLDLVPDPVVVTRVEDMRYVDANRAFGNLLGRSPEEARARFESQVRRIQALRDIDMAITASLDVRVTLNVVLDQVTAQLGVDAADVLLVNEATRSLEFAAGRGFRTGEPRATRLEYGQGYAGRAAERRELVRVPDLGEELGSLARSTLVEEEGFITYMAAPLMAKGRVNGVLEIFHRSRLDPTQDWFDFLDTLAGQASIAVDSAELYQDLQRSHEELRDAYDRTIEGWARALDLRDRETHGHTRRVAEVSVALARRLGVVEDQLVHLREEAGSHFDPEVVEAFLELDLDAIHVPERTDAERLPGVQTDLFGADDDGGD